MPPDRITLDVFRVVLLAPAGLTTAEQESAARPLRAAAFRRRLRRAAARACRRHPALAGVTVRVDR